jgi:hypothetical protein
VASGILGETRFRNNLIDLPTRIRPRAGAAAGLVALKLPARPLIKQKDKGETQMILDGNNKTYELCPPGFHQVVLADIVDIGVQETRYGPKPKIRLVWLVGSNDSTGKPFRLFQQATASGHEKSKLYAILNDALGRPPQRPIDTEQYIGLQAQALVIHNLAANGRTYANVKVLTPAAAGQAVQIPADFKRKSVQATQVTAQTQAVVQHMQAARAPQVPQAVPEPNIHGVTITDDDIPF